MSTTDQRAPELAGMALANGVLLLGPTSWSCASLDRDGAMQVQTGRRPCIDARLAGATAFVRGPLRLIEQLAVLPHVRRRAPHARFGFEEPHMIATILATSLLTRARPATLTSAASLVVTLIAMRRGELTRWHGAEHKSIAAHERGIPSTAASRVHPRCGTQLALPMFVASIAASALLQRVGLRSPRTARAAGQLVGVSVASELFRAAQRGRGGVVVDATQRAGLWLQRRVTTSEPTDAQLRVVDAAREALLARERAIAEERRSGTSQSLP